MPLTNTPQINLTNMLLQILRLMNVLLRKLNHTVHDVLVGTSNQIKDTIQMLTTKGLVVLLKRVLYYLNHLQNQGLRTVMTNLTVNLLLNVHRHISRKRCINVQQNTTYLVSIRLTRYLRLYMRNHLKIRCEVTTNIVQQVYRQELEITQVLGLKNL